MLTRSGPLRRTRLRPVSRKRARVQRQRMGLIRGMFAEPAPCVVPGCGQVATDPHEPLTRARGGPITDESNIVGLCRAHHKWTHENPEAAHKAGLLRHSWE